MKSDAIVYPGAVVVKSLHAPVADVAVARVCCEDHFAPRAELAWLPWITVELLDHLAERDLWTALHVPGLSGCRQCVEHLERDEQQAHERKPYVSIDVREYKEDESYEGRPEHCLTQYEHLPAWHYLLERLLEGKARYMSRLLV